jgi:ABC-2 type transport system ATP-binding protein
VAEGRRSKGASLSIQLRELSKYYQVHRKAPGLRGSLRNLFRREYETVKAVDDISFSIRQGEVVGFLGPS